MHLSTLHPNSGRMSRHEVGCSRLARALLMQLEEAIFVTATSLLPVDTEKLRFSRFLKTLGAMFPWAILVARSVDRNNEDKLAIIRPCICG